MPGLATTRQPDAVGVGRAGRHAGRAGIVGDALGLRIRTVGRLVTRAGAVATGAHGGRALARFLARGQDGPPAVVRWAGGRRSRRSRVGAAACAGTALAEAHSAVVARLRGGDAIGAT